MPRTRTTKKLAQRIDLNYFKRPTPLKRAKLWLSLLLPVIALTWITYHFATRDSRVYSSGRLSEPHAVFETQCAACHVQQAGSFNAKAENSACLACHDGPVHHAEQTRTLDCAECHVEHRRKINLSAASSQSCATCHSDLRANGGTSHFAANIRSFEDGHPQFAALKEGMRDAGTIKLNHSLHLKPIRRSPTGPNVQLACTSCHNLTAADPDLTYSDAKYRGASVSYGDRDSVLTIPAGTLVTPRPASGRELMAPVKFANACSACHLLTFDKRFDEGVPHDKPEVVHGFLVKKFTNYIAAHPSELHEMQDPARDLTGKPLPLRMRTLTPSQWIQEKVAVAEELLSRKTCAQCHQMTQKNLPDTGIARWSPSNPQAPMRIPDSSTSSTSFTSSTSSFIPAVAPANTTLRWLPHSKFDHSAHTGFSCTSCHSKTLTSTDSSDVLIPGITTCQTCHAPGPNHAESRCFECHTYHDWSRRKEVKPAFTLPALRSGM
jgi:hypothetical protein